ncbi:MAG: glyoxalase [Candidatus Methanomethylophilaceae archaeon]|nr:glyoxalase [Candidatus Methanomethylophilaceae archaeon]MDD2778776.1 glyoxalase [Candidatus Methanomethylophilaceae archaeon]
MPLGDPSGGSFEYTVEGLPESLAGAFIPVRDTGSSSRFYNRVLKMDLVSDDGETAVVGRKGFYLVLRKSQIFGVDTGIILGVDNPYDLHRRFIDEGVVFVRDPLRGPIGVYTSFRDEDGNVLHAVDRRAMGQRVDPPGTETNH